MLTKKEINLLIVLVKVEKELITFICGFGKPTKEQKERNSEYKKLINKLEKML